MTTTVRGDGIVFNDGTLQTTASTAAQGATIAVRGTGYSATMIPANGEGIITTFTIANSRYFGPGTIHQSWKSLASSRSTGVTYYNTSNRGMAIGISTGRTGGWASVTITVNGATAATQGGDQQGGYGGSNVNATAIIPPGASYSVASTVGIEYWAELS